MQELGLKGTKIGGAMVSFEHGNFITNDGSATARNVLDLIELIKAKAQAERGIELHGSGNCRRGLSLCQRFPS